jgi:hypothetical protein
LGKCGFLVKKDVDLFLRNGVVGRSFKWKGLARTRGSSQWLQLNYRKQNNRLSGPASASLAVFSAKKSKILFVRPPIPQWRGKRGPMHPRRQDN